MLRYPFLLLYLFSSLPVGSSNLSISDDLEALIKERLAEAALKSWELGTRTQTLLELDARPYSVFSSNSLPPSPQVPEDIEQGIAPVFFIANTTVQDLELESADDFGPEPLMEDGSAADPASIGVSVLLANWTNQPDDFFATAAQNQLDYLYFRVPRTDDGAISHRVSEAQLWSDFIYMVPPFLAYFGVVTDNSTLLADSFNQIRLYRSYLRDPDRENLWKHILLGSGVDHGHWTTGNGWAAMGMMRVLATIRNSRFADDYENEQNDLVYWTKEILNGIYVHLDETNIFGNYPERSIGNGNFYDAAGTALIAASTYRLAMLSEEYHNLPAAENIRTTLSSQEFDGSWVHFDQDGWLTPVVNPHSFSREGSESAEGQAFVLMMQQAWREWVEGGSVGANSAVRLPRVPTHFFLANLIVLIMVLIW